MVHSANITVNRMALPAPTIGFNQDGTQRGDVVVISKVVDGGEMPVGARIYYTTDGTDPGDDGRGNPTTGTLYTGPSTRSSRTGSPSRQTSWPASTRRKPMPAGSR